MTTIPAQTFELAPREGQLRLTLPALQSALDVIDDGWRAGVVVDDDGGLSWCAGKAQRLEPGAASHGSFTDEFIVQRLLGHVLVELFYKVPGATDSPWDERSERFPGELWNWAEGNLLPIRI